MTTTEFHPIDPAGLERVASGDREVRRVSNAFTLTHPSREPVLADWCEVAMPWQIAKDRGLLDGKRAAWVDAVTGRETPAVLRRVRGRQSAFFDVLTEFGDAGVAEGDILEDVGNTFRSEFVLHPHLRDGVLRMPTVWGTEPEAGNVTTLAETDAIRRWLAVYPEHAAEPEVFAYVETIVRSMDPVVTVNVSMRRRAVEDNGGGVVLWMHFGPGAIVTDPMESGLDIREGNVEIVHDLDWGTSPTWTLQVHYVGSQGDPITAQAEANAGRGEPWGVYNGWGEPNDPGRWFALGVRPRGHFHHDEDVREGLRARGSDYNAPRPMSQQLNAGQGGAQRFGQTLAGWMFGCDPMAATLLRLAAEDELLRPIHWIDGNGKGLRAVDRPRYLLVDREPHQNHTRGWTDEFGALPPGITPAGRRTTDDVLHVDDLALAAYLALRDDCWAIEDCYRQIVEREAAAVRLQVGWFTRARGFGRSTKSLADAAWLFNGEDTGTTAVAAIMARLHIALGNWKGRAVTDPGRVVRPTDYQLDPRLLGGRHHGVIPYEEATVVAGLVAASHVLPREQRVQALGMAYHVANTIHALACVDSDTGPWFAYGVGIPVGNDLGKLPPEGFDDPATATHADWVHGNRDSGWTRWSIAASYLLPYICEALTAELGTTITSPYLDTADWIVSASEGRMDWIGVGDELYRFAACPTSTVQAAYLESAQPRDGVGRL